ncbi:hypothetical protein SeMB42_g05270 [Synchytrium endobioticum]|uniref:Uncharacterized protein n=1 Tax=Synchytrium endobioticum TaxID=286115 RepID=A0A507CSJ9_9FUNG|nr:hypothetical protein SeMB42_g05270 [Synchytrium endobioticum]
MPCQLVIQWGLPLLRAHFGSVLYYCILAEVTPGRRRTSTRDIRLDPDSDPLDIQAYNIIQLHKGISEIQPYGLKMVLQAFDNSIGTASYYMLQHRRCFNDPDIDCETSYIGKKDDANKARGAGLIRVRICIPAELGKPLHKVIDY